jgi:hypothetical protein
MRDTVNHAFHRNPIGTDESGNMRRRRVGMKIEIDRNHSENQEKEGGNPGSPPGLFQEEQEDPGSEQKQKEREQIGGPIGEVKMAEIDP